MRNALFSLGTGSLPRDDLGIVSFGGTNGFRATAKRQMRLEFVRNLLLLTVTLITVQQNHAIEQGRDSASSPAFSRTDSR